MPFIIFFYFFIHIFMKKLDLHEFEIIGTEIGYPFYVYDDGSYGKRRRKAKLRTILEVQDCVEKPDVNNRGKFVQHVVTQQVEVDDASYKQAKFEGTTYNKKTEKSGPESYAQMVALQHARQLLRAKKTLDSKDLFLICKYASAIFVRKYVFDRVVFSANRVEAWSCLLARTDIPELLTFVKRHLAEHGNDVVLCESLILFANEEIVSWFVQQKKIVHFCDELEIALLRRCFANKNFYLLERYLKCCGMYPKYRLNPKPQRVLVEEAIHNKEVLGWFKSYFVKDALL